MCMSSEKNISKTNLQVYSSKKYTWLCQGGTISQGREKENRKDKFVFLTKNQRSINYMFFAGKTYWPTHQDIV